MSDRKSSRKAAGKRYTRSQRAKIVRLASRIGAGGAAERSGASTWSIYRWRHVDEEEDVIGDKSALRPG